MVRGAVVPVLGVAHVDLEAHEELQPLFAFLRAPPACELSIFKRAVAQPIKAGDAAGLARLRVRPLPLLSRMLTSNLIDMHCGLA